MNKAYLGNISTGLPYCYGTFVNKSMAANAWTTFAPNILDSNFNFVVSGNDIIIPSKGRWSVNVWSMNLTTAPAANSQNVYRCVMGMRYQLPFSTPNLSLTPDLYFEHDVPSGTVFNFSVYLQAAQTGFSQIPQFILKRIL